MPISVPSFRRFLITAWLGVCLFTTACVTPPENTPAQPQPTCTPPNANPYLSHGLSPEMAAIFSNRFVNIGTTRQDALSQLGRNTEYWSDQVNVAIDDFQMVRIVITYLDPVLVQYIVLNYALNDPGIVLDDASFILTLDETMNKLGGRDEMLFIVTITSPFYRELAYNNNVLTVRMPIEQLALVSSGDIRVTPTHEDHILDENIDITHGPVSGIVGYPLGVTIQEQCTWIIDQWTNTLTLEIPSVTLGALPFNTQFWSIPYQPLVRENNIHQIPTYDATYASSPISKLETPPTPNWEPNAQFDDTNWTVYWEDMGRYIWNLVITESHH
jgi:hypothetical protein